MTDCLSLIWFRVWIGILIATGYAPPVETGVVHVPSGTTHGPVFSFARFSCLRDGLLPSIIAMVVTKVDLPWVAERAIRLVGVGWE